MTTLEPGTLVDQRYCVERKLGQGGMGAVFLAHDRNLERPVVIKQLLPELLADGQSVQRFAREADAAVHLSCVHSVRVYDVGRLPGGVPFIVMEYLEGRDLGAVIEEEGRLEPSRAVGYVLQALEGLAEAHARGIVHRDIKPQNLFLTKNVDAADLVKLLDFGIAKAPIGEGETKLTRTAACMGSPAYMAPEQIREFAKVDARADIWAIGCCLYELLTGRVPFEADNVADVLVRALTASPLAPDVMFPDIPPALSAVVLRCLEKDASARFQTVGALARALYDATALDAKCSRARVDRILALRGALPPLDETLPVHVERWDDATASGAVKDSKPERTTRRLGFIAALTTIALFGAGTIALQRRAASSVRVDVLTSAAIAHSAPPPVETMPAPALQPTTLEPLTLELGSEPAPAGSAPRRSLKRAVPGRKTRPSAPAAREERARDPGREY